jgi:hypothetical protein
MAFVMLVRGLALNGVSNPNPRVVFFAFSFTIFIPCILASQTSLFGQLITLSKLASGFAYSSNSGILFYFKATYSLSNQ